MDKKNTIIGVALLAGAFASFYFSSKYAPPPPIPAITANSSGSLLARNEAPATGPASSPADASLRAPSTKPIAPAEYVELSNSCINVRLTTAGGAIDSIKLRKHKAILDHDAPYTLNAGQYAPALSFSDLPGLDANVRYALVSHTDREAVYRTVLDGQLEVTRRYTLLSGDGTDPYQIRHETTFLNLGDKLVSLPRTALNLGTAIPLNEQDTGMYLDAGYYNGKDTEFTRRDELAGGGFFTRPQPQPYLDKIAPVT